MEIFKADRLGESGEMMAEKIKSLDAQISNMARAIAIAPDVVELAQRMVTLDSERQNLQVRLAQSKRTCAPDRADLNRHWASVAGKTLSLLRSGADVARMRTELMKWIEAIRLDGDSQIAIKWKSSTIFENLTIAGLKAADLNTIPELQEWRALHLSGDQPATA